MKETMVGIFSAIGSTLCCTLPLLLGFLGASGFVSNLAWISALKPFFILIAMVSIAYAWYRHLKPKAACCKATIVPFHKKRGFLIGMTVFIFGMLFLPAVF